MEVSIRNTFIVVDAGAEEGVGSRRSCSAPPAIREAEAELGLAGRAKPTPSSSSTVSSTAVSDCGGSQLGDESSTSTDSRTSSPAARAARWADEEDDEVPPSPPARTPLRSIGSAARPFIAAGHTQEAALPTTACHMAQPWSAPAQAPPLASAPWPGVAGQWSPPWQTWSATEAHSNAAEHARQPAQELAAGVSAGWMPRRPPHPKACPRRGSAAPIGLDAFLDARERAPLARARAAAVRAPREWAEMPAVQAVQLPPEPPGVSPGTSRVLAKLRRALSQAPEVVDVQVVSGPETSLLVEVSAAEGAASAALKMAKTAVLNAAAMSLNSYVVGFLADPFEDIGGKGGFSVSVGVVPPSAEKKICWSFYERGCCQQGPNCSKRHPAPAELERLRVAIK